MPLQKTEASPAACSVGSRSQQKSFLFLLEEIRRAQNWKSRENFFAGWRALASGGGAASIFGVGFPLKKGSRKVYNYSTSIKIEAGKNQNPTLDTLKKIAKALEVSLDELTK